ncbi:MAG: hypothetical protein AAGI71_04070 [Bacteroidota bacterium]
MTGRSATQAWTLCLSLLLILSGCLPYGCNRQDSRELFPADSLSRAVAEQVPVDTLTVRWSSTGPEETPLAFPRTVQFGPGEALHVADPELSAILVFEPDGRVRTVLAEGAFEVPFLAGQRGDTLVVFDPVARSLGLLAEGTVVRRIPTPDDVPEQGPLQYAAAGPGGYYVKTLGEDVDGSIARLEPGGAVATRTPLPGPHWRHAGLLRTYGDSLISLSGFRPVIDVLTPEGQLDTLSLVGFDSPMLARSRLFMLGEKHQAPLLTESAALAGDQLFVLNMRPGWVQIDVFGLDGRLRHRLTQPNPQARRNFYPRDLAARLRPDGSYDLAVIFSDPDPSVTLYRWRPPVGSQPLSVGAGGPSERQTTQ